MSEKPDAAGAPKSKKMLIIIVAAVLVLVLGGAGAFFFISKQRAAAEARTKVLIAEHLTLTDLRKARKLTQARLAKKLGITLAIVFALFHLTRSPKNWSVSSLKQTAVVAWVKIQQLK